MVKNTDEQPNGEIHRVRCGEAPSAGTSVPIEVRGETLPAWTWAHQASRSLNLILLGFVWRYHHVGAIDY